MTSAALLLCILAGCLTVSAQTQQGKVKWQITHVQTTEGLKPGDIDEASKSALDIQAYFDGKILEIKDFNIFNLEADHRENDGFVQRKIFYFRDRYGQTGRLALHADPTCVNKDMRYLIFIQFDEKEGGRVFICEKPTMVKEVAEPVDSSKVVPPTREECWEEGPECGPAE